LLSGSVRPEGADQVPVVALRSRIWPVGVPFSSETVTPTHLPETSQSISLIFWNFPAVAKTPADSRDHVEPFHLTTSDVEGFSFVWPTARQNVVEGHETASKDWLPAGIVALVIDVPFHTKAAAVCTYPPCPSDSCADPTTTQKVCEPQDTSLMSKGDGQPEDGTTVQLEPFHAERNGYAGSPMPDPLARPRPRQNVAEVQETETRECE
jgi:hypothetical protein